MTTKTDTEQLRADFEAHFRKPPFEWEFHRYGEDSAWPGNYQQYEHQCAWEGWVARAALQSQHDEETKNLRDALWIAERNLEALQSQDAEDAEDAERYRWLCDKFGITKLPCAIERIIAGDVYVADGKAGIDEAIDHARRIEGGGNE